MGVDPFRHASLSFKMLLKLHDKPSPLASLKLSYWQLAAGVALHGVDFNPLRLSGEFGETSEISVAPLRLDEIVHFVACGSCGQIICKDDNELSKCTKCSTSFLNFPMYSSLINQRQRDGWPFCIGLLH